MPLVSTHPQISAAHRGTYVLRRPDGAQIVVIFSDSAETLDLADKLIRNSELLPGEDPALLPEPDRAETFDVVHAFDSNFAEIGRES